MSDLQIVFIPLYNPSINNLEYPFSFISQTENDTALYIINDFIRPIPTDTDKSDPGNFPNNITEYYWIREGENDGQAWELLCKLDNDCYVFYTASCDYTGFDCQGFMKAYISKDKNAIFYMGMNEEERKRCLQDKNIYVNERI
jgi:hypothetical protein